MNFLLHTSSEGKSFALFLEEVLLHSIIEILPAIPFLFAAYLLLEIIEHKTSGKSLRIMEKSGFLSSVFGGLLGAVPQCGFSSAAANFYTGRIISLGALISVFLSTSDEMLLIMISKNVPFTSLLTVLLYKIAVGIAVGLIIDLIIRLMKLPQKEIDIDAICDEANCKCENGIIRSTLHHTLSTGLFITVITLLINTLIFFVGQESISLILYDKPVISHFLAALIGLLPSCAVSVTLTDLCIERIITCGTMLSGLFANSGLGLLVLLRINKNKKENLLIISILLVSGFVFGLLADVVGFSEMFGF